MNKPICILFSLVPRLLLAALMLITPRTSRAQSSVGDIVYTVGTVTTDANGQDWAYILWKGTQASLISNQVFAVYSKSGDVTNATPYVRRSIVTIQTDARVIEPLLRRAANLGDDLFKLQSDLLQLFASFMPSNAISRADQLSAVIRGSLNDSRYYENLLLLGGNHAGINLALGFADAELIPHGLTTFEVRVYDPIGDRDLAVIGRVTLEAGHPTVLPRPGPPVLVPELSAKGDLNIHLRWGTPDDLRRLSLMQFGYNLYRVEKHYADSKGWNEAVQPPLAALTDLVSTNPAAAKRVNTVPLTPSKMFSLAEAANVVPPTGDTNTSFIMDDDHRGRKTYVNLGFTNGAQFYYYAAARDVLGRDGQLSQGLMAVVCDRMPPLPPFAVHVKNEYTYDTATMSSNQALRVVWRQNVNTNDVTTNYWIYRWTNLVEMNALSGMISNNLIGVVPHIPGATNNSFLDNGPTSPSALNAYGKTYWYTVRSGDAGACGQNLSGPGGPAFGVLRDRNGPPAGDGTIEINCLQPYVTALKPQLNKLRTADTNNYDSQIICTRADPRFEWAEFYAIANYGSPTGGGTTVSNYLGLAFFVANDKAVTSWAVPRNPQYETVSFKVFCRAALANGKISDWVESDYSAFGTASFADVEFIAFTQATRTTLGSTINSGPCRVHDPGAGGGGSPGTNNIIVHLFPTPGSEEYRIYRRVDDGPLSLLCQGQVTNIASIITCFEDAPPVNGGTICFYGQLLDGSGNPSPMFIIGCVDCAPNTPPPTPVLAKITPTGDAGSAGMQLSWFCPPYGVERFELRIAGLPTMPNTNLNALSVLLFANGGTPSTMIYTNYGTNLSLQSYSFKTPKVGPDFGNNGAQFIINANVDPNKQYYVEVRAIGPNNTPGAFSVIRDFVWSTTNAPGPDEPWPALTPPSTSANFFALAYPLSATSPVPALNTARYEGSAVLLGLAPFSDRVSVSTREKVAIIGQAFDPVSVLLTNALGDGLFPCAMYRYQVPNALFPTPARDVIQVTPLMENIAYQLNGSQGQTNTLIQDPFVTCTQSVDPTHNYLWLWLLDTQPQISGARYKYVIVRFKENHEIDQLIPSNEVDVP